MNKFRKWLFKFIFGHELIEYMDVLHQWGESIEAMKRAHEMNDRLIEANGRTIKLANEIHGRCTILLKKCEGMGINENLGR